jgi:hypothetical protein
MVIQIALHVPNGENQEVIKVIALRPGTVNLLKGLLDPRVLKNVNFSGLSALEFTKAYYSTF